MKLLTLSLTAVSILLGIFYNTHFFIGTIALLLVYVGIELIQSLTNENRY